MKDRKGENGQKEEAKPQETTLNSAGTIPSSRSTIPAEARTAVFCNLNRDRLGTNIQLGRYYDVQEHREQQPEPSALSSTVTKDHLQHQERRLALVEIIAIPQQLTFLVIGWEEELLMSEFCVLFFQSQQRSQNSGALNTCWETMAQLTSWVIAAVGLDCPFWWMTTRTRCLNP